jgi:hypothetical protein
MERNLRSKITMLAGLLALGLAAQGVANATPSAEANGAKATQQQVDQNIKGHGFTNNPADEMPAPVAKGGPATRGETCHLHVNNVTPWIIQLFVDGSPVGAVSPWGDAYGTYSSGPRMFYGVATFSDGSAPITFGPSAEFCDGTFNWNLRR